ncbi:MAG TPA: CopG family transcriptional regulator [Nocardioides sp.]|uniref:CopG family transcriptional regulator n=1 Tax=Nocardioides sp. TaxID=35761 RepID=UPI002E346E8A|nr:CopG family transcriptional regulator [Nocardioides sp.]HEX5089312.1 CopG family transcriptional regulator [Nocardioides sp.]
MTLRLNTDLDRALTERARREGRSKQEVARAAIEAYVEHYTRRELLDLVLDTELPRYEDALDRLGQ